MTAKRIGAVLAILHVGILTAFLIYIHSDAAERSQAAFYWLIWFPIDFPWSILNSVLRWAIPDGVDHVLGVPRYTLAEYWRIIVHGGIGTLWWYFIPRLVAMLFRRRPFAR